MGLDSLRELVLASLGAGPGTTPQGAPMVCSSEHPFHPYSGPLGILVHPSLDCGLGRCLAEQMVPFLHYSEVSISVAKRGSETSSGLLESHAHWHGWGVCKQV